MNKLEKDVDTVRIAIRIPKNLKNEIETIATDTGLNISTYIRTLIISDVKKKK